MKIVTLGDSLTVGETEFQFVDSVKPASYPEYLEWLAEHYLSSHGLLGEVRVVNKGVSGDLTSGMLERFSEDVIDENPDCVIILGGTNDIGWGLDPAAITHNLTNIYDRAMDKGIMPVACSVPSILGLDDLIPPRITLNRMISTEAEKRRITFVDVFNATADSETNRLLEEYSADGLHLTPKGYQQIGRCIFDKWLRPILDQQAK